MKDTLNLLEHVSLITKKYADLAEYTGENFNVFNILNIFASEINHSAFIANLLNTKGKHGQKNIFLKLFIEEIQNLFEEKSKLETFKFSTSHAVIEKHIGRIDYDTNEGGRIDVFITDGINNLIIENKIWAGDQPNQLIRYNNVYKGTPIVYLTLHGQEPRNYSKGNLEVGKDFICVSYETHIKSWLEKCIKEMANKPIIRETLNQYLHLVKQLTNQTQNNSMAQDLLDLIFRNEYNFNSAKEIVKVLNERETHLEKILEQLSAISNEEIIAINTSIKSVFPEGYLKIVKKWTQTGMGKVMRFDLIIDQEGGKHQTSINIQLYIHEYQIQKKVYTSDKMIEEKLHAELLSNQIESYYDLQKSKDEIYNDINDLITTILNIFK